MKNLAKKFNPRLDQIEVSVIRKFDEQVTNIEGIIKLTLGEPDFNTPEHVKEEGRQAIKDNFSHYTGMKGLEELRYAASQFFEKKYHISYKPDSEILVTIGATEAISASLLSVLEAGDKVLLPAPIYPGYEPVIQLAGAEPVYMDTTPNDFILTPAMIAAAMAEHGEKVKAIILNYPSNPTGVTYTRAEVKAIATELKKYELFVISDEVYSELTYAGTHVSIAEFIPEQTILINGLSKSHAMTGWRLGFILSNEAFIKEIVKVHQYLVTAASTNSQKAAISALTEGINDAQVMKKEYIIRRDFVYKEMKELGFKVAKPNGAFYIFAKIPANCIQDSMAFCVDLAEKKALAIIPGIAFGKEAEGYVRISYAASMENLEQAMTRLRSYIEQTASI